MRGRVRAVGWSMDQDQVDVIAKSRERGVNARGRWYRWALYLFRYDGVGPAFELRPRGGLLAGCPLGSLVRLAARTPCMGGSVEGRNAHPIGSALGTATHFVSPPNCYPTSK